jgi:dTDP-4-dehydrorhamnose reductase
MKTTSHYNSGELADLSGKTVIITGGGGMLGTAFNEILGQYVSGPQICCLSREELDVTNYSAVMRLEKQKPDLILHCAAIVNADYCEEHQDEAYRVKITGTKNIIEIAKKTGAPVFFPQSFLIYDGLQTPITEETKPNPLSVYGKLKLQAEQLILREIPNSLIVRMAGFFGGREVDKNFVGKFVRHIAKVIKEGQTSMEVGDRVWQPTYTNDLAYNSLILLAAGKKGIYCMSSHGKASFYELSCEIIKELNLDGKFKIQRVAAQKVSENEKATRPGAAIIENKRLISEGLDRQRTWQDSLRDYISQPYFRELLT